MYIKKLILFTAVLLAVNILLPKKSLAAEKILDSSATLKSAQKTEVTSDMRTVALQNVLRRYNSVLTPYAPAYVKYADKYGVDWRLLPAISGLESYFATFYVPGTYNAYGWGGGYIYFDSWENGIETINRALREKYINRGADDVWSIGPIYAENPAWSERVNYFIQEIDREYVKLTTLSLVPTL